MLMLGPVDSIKGHAAPEHLRFEIGSMLHPIQRFADPKSWFLTQLTQLVVYSQRPSGSLLHHQKGIVREYLIIHGTSRPESCPAL